MTNILSEKTIGVLQEILIQQLRVERAQLTPEAGLETDLGADSLDKVEIAMRLEEAFNLTIPDRDVEQIDTVGDLYEALATLLGRSGQPA